MTNCASGQKANVSDNSARTAQMQASIDPNSISDKEAKARKFVKLPILKQSSSKGQIL